MKKWIWVLGLLIAGTAWAGAESVGVKSLPPSVVKTVPACGETAVDATATKQISITFSKDMKNGNWSWSQMSDDTFPRIVGSPRYLDDKRTCVIDVQLEPGKAYVIWANTEKFTNFKDTNGNPAIPYLLVFETKP